MSDAFSFTPRMLSSFYREYAQGLPGTGANPAGRMVRRTSAKNAGIALIQVIVAMGLIAVCGALGIRALMEMNRKAAGLRLLTNARAIVQRNIDSAIAVPFTSSNIPPILAIGSSIWDDDGGNDSKVNVVVPRSGNGAVIKGDLLRTVTSETNSVNADIRRVTFTLAYKYRGKDYSFTMSTIRTTD